MPIFGNVLDVEGSQMKIGLSVGIPKLIKRKGYLTVQNTYFILDILVHSETCQI